MPRASGLIIRAYIVSLLILSVGLPCFAKYIPCKLGNYSDQLTEKIRNLDGAEGDFDYDTMCCNSTSWVVDEKKGILGVGFQLPAEGKVKHLKLEKFISNEWKVYTNWKLFRKDYIMSGNGAPINTSLCEGYTSEEFGYHTFEYISSGLYRLSSCKHVERNITTQFDESPLKCKASKSVNIGPWNKDKTFSVTLTLYQPLTKKMDRIYTLYDVNKNLVVTKWSIRSRKVDNQPIVCETDGRIPVAYNSTPDLEDDDDDTSFLIENLLPGQYELGVISRGQLANENTILSKCTIRSTITFSNLSNTNQDPIAVPTIELPKTGEKGNVLVSYMIGMVSVFALCSCYYIIHICRRRNILEPRVKPGGYDNINVRKKILLLYARDCYQFNEMMVTFRKLLKHSNFQVFDCYDPECSREVDRNQTLWIRDLVNDSEVQVVVVASRCARLQHTAVTNRRTFQYRQPHHLDRLFIYGLADVINIHRDVYQRIFRVALQDFTEKDDMLLLLGESRIYTLPALVLELIRDLRCSSKTPEETEDLKKLVTTLKEKHNILVSHKNTNPYYLHNIVLQH